MRGIVLIAFLFSSMQAVSSLSQAARRDIEDDIARHAWALVTLKRRLNSLTLIAGLPPELLSEIFLHLARDIYYGNRLEATYSYHCLRPPTWITVTHICHSWRELALNSPRLWSYIVLSRRPFVSEFLARSKKAPLRITAAFAFCGDEKIKVLEDVLHGERQRLTELQLIAPSRTLLDACQKLGQSAPLLETLVLSEHMTPSYTVDHTHISHTVLSLSLPHLRTVEFRRIKISWDHPIFSAHLTKLVVHGPAIGRVPMGTFERFLLVLERMPELQVLDLYEMIPPLPAENIESLPPVSRKVTLPRLRHISLSSYQMECANLLNHLTLPKDVRLDLVGRWSKADRESLVEVIKEHLSRSLPLQTLHFRRDFRYGQSQVLNGWRTLVDLVEPPLPASHLRLNITSRPIDIAHITCNTNAFANIQRLYISAELNDGEWESLFMGIPNIRFLSLRGDLTADFIEAFSYVLREYPNPVMVLPSLQVLKLRDSRLSSGEHANFNKPLMVLMDPSLQVLKSRDIHLLSAQTPEFVDLLVDCLIKRCNYGVPVQELHLTDCANTFAEDVRRLEEVVPDVKWDGIERCEEEEFYDDFAV